ncbi:MAG: hypothetical protein RLZZ519_2339, partial [Bacteroidota bacterium]
ATNDCNETNNFDQSCVALNAPYDPNAKAVAAQNFAAKGYVTEDTIASTDTLEYRVDFQNVGTSAAQNVEVHDDLDTLLLDIHSLQMISASHSYGYVILGNRLILRFEDIQLPDSTTDETGSHGFFRFRIRQRPGNPQGTVIANSANIYFDYEAPVATNVTHNTIPIPIVVNQDLAYEHLVHVRPNPGNDRMIVSLSTHAPAVFNLMDGTGKLISCYIIEALETEMQTAQLPNGLYFYAAYSEGKCIGVGKWVKQ